MVHPSADQTPEQTPAQRLAARGVVLASRYRSTLSPNKLDADMLTFVQENAQLLQFLESEIARLELVLANSSNSLAPFTPLR